MNRLSTFKLLAPVLLTVSLPIYAQHKPMEATPAQQQASRRTRLVLKDGTYQLVMSYEVRGNVVRYLSAERNGAVEEIPLALVDLPATEKWAQEHVSGVAAPSEPAAVISPELAREEADRAARTPEVAKDLRLPEEDSVLALDTFHGTPELVPLAQAASDLNRETAHAVQRVDVNPASSAHRIGDIRGERADVQLHVQDPVFFVRVGKDDSDDSSGGTLTVDTHGQSAVAAAATGSEASRYVIERVDVRQGLRQVDSFRLYDLGSGNAQRDVIECKAERLPGGHWLRLTPSQPMLFGEYALVEVLSDRSVNIDVWDFGVHPDAKENTEALHPEPPRPVQLERRRP